MQQVEADDEDDDRPQRVEERKRREAGLAHIARHQVDHHAHRHRAGAARHPREDGGSVESVRPRVVLDEPGQAGEQVDEDALEAHEGGEDEDGLPADRVAQPGPHRQRDHRDALEIDGAAGVELLRELLDVLPVRAVEAVAPVRVVALQRQRRRVARLDRGDVDLVILHRVRPVDVILRGQVFRRPVGAAAAGPRVEERAEEVAVDAALDAHDQVDYQQEPRHAHDLGEPARAARPEVPLAAPHARAAAPARLGLPVHQVVRPAVPRHAAVGGVPLLRAPPQSATGKDKKVCSPRPARGTIGAPEQSTGRGSGEGALDALFICGAHTL